MMPTKRGGARPNTGPLPSLIRTADALHHALIRHAIHCDRHGKNEQLDQLETLITLVLLIKDRVNSSGIDTIPELATGIE